MGAGRVEDGGEGGRGWAVHAGPPVWGQRLRQFVLQLVAGLLHLGEQLLIAGEQFVRVGVGDAGVVGVLDVEVVAGRLDLGERDLPGVFVRCAIGVRRLGGGLALPSFALALLLRRLAIPPGFFGVELLDVDGLGLVVRLHARRIGVFVVPDVLRLLALREEQQVRLDPGVRGEDAIRQPDDRVQVALGQQLFLDRHTTCFHFWNSCGKSSRNKSAPTSWKK